jgi:hypothetical protein
MNVMNHEEALILMAAANLTEEISQRVAQGAMNTSDAVDSLFMARTCEKLSSARDAIRSALGCLDVWVDDPEAKAAGARLEVAE